MKVSFAITVSTELEEIKTLLPFLLEHKKETDEIVVLFDEKHGDEYVWGYLKEFESTVGIHVRSSSDFDYDFASWKNKLNSYCTGDYIFQLDADELITEYMVQGVHDIISMNPETDLFFLPRTNYVEGITEEHIEKWSWNKDSNGRINFPDYQGRIYRKDMLWHGKVHERIVGAKYYSLLPSEESEYCIQHNKTIKKQEKQNTLYNSI